MVRSWHCRSGVTLLEIMVVISIAAVLLGIVTVSSRHATVNRTLDASSGEVFELLEVARSKAVSQGESKVEITTGSNGDEAAKQIDTTLKLYDAENNVCSIVNVPPAISLTPKGKTTIKYNSAGGLSSHSSDVNIVMTASTSRTAKLTVNRLTGTVKRVQE